LQEEHNHHLQEKYRKMKTEVRYEEISCADAEYIVVAYGSSARISQKAIEMARAKGIKAGLLRPITLFPFPEEVIGKYAQHVKGFLSVEMSAGQMLEDVRLAVNGKVRVEHYGRYGGIVHSPEEVLQALEEKLVNS
jgi:2-oxoglutarate ferredoxin oxidoreductase subunit alpha